eukprot:5045444-Alexandrium_andersonii.AAC.1
MPRAAAGPRAARGGVLRQAPPAQGGNRSGVGHPVPGQVREAPAGARPGAAPAHGDGHARGARQECQRRASG